MIDIRNLTFKYIGRKAQALTGIDLHIEKGETVLLLGSSGSGKSTLALCLNGLIPQVVGGRMEGQVRVAGLDTRKYRGAVLGRAVPGRLGRGAQLHCHGLVCQAAHRLNTVVHADKIVVLEDGRIVEQGAHDDLMRAGELYRRMWDEQQKVREWKFAQEQVAKSIDI
jgi:ABC-type multidrug transport system fused ATPase/permease subunit